MIGFAPVRISVTELMPSGEPLDEFAARSGRDRSELARLITLAGSRLQRELALPDAPFEITGASFTVSGIAGLIPLAPGLELEVAPKFLGQSYDNWRTDFYVIASISRFGRVLDSDVLAGTTPRRGDLATLVGQSMVRMYQRNERRPLRLYKRRRWTDFELSGEVEAESLLMPSDLGFDQDATILESKNAFNQMIGAAAGVLLQEIRDPAIRQQVGRIAARFPNSTSVARRRPPTTVPARHRQWQPLYSLATQVVLGRGIDYSGRELLAPGFAIKMADAWQDFLAFSLEAELGTATVRRLVSFPWGYRGPKVVNVTPDVAIYLPGGMILLDAKYKGRADDPQRRIAASDAYEAIAFATAADVQTIILAYPRSGSWTRSATGEVSQVDLLEVNGRRVVGVDVECRGISEPGGLRTFSERVARSLGSVV